VAKATYQDRRRHILHSIEVFEGYWTGRTLADYGQDEPKPTATERHFLIIAEAVKHIPDSEKTARPYIGWRDIIRLGNLLRHGYDVVENDRVWDIVQADLGPLKTTIKDMLNAP
jgi:uncharacterized protein with HEPN domain